MTFTRRGLKLLDSLKTYAKNVERFDAIVALRKMEVKTITDGTFVANFVVTPEMCNFHDVLHGGCTAALVDATIQYGYYAHPLGDSAVTTNLNITYLARAKLGDKIRLECRPLKITGKTGTMDCIMINEENGEMLSRGTGSLVSTGAEYRQHGIKIFGFDMSESNV